MAQLSDGQKSAIRARVAEETEGMTYSYDRLALRSQVVRDLAREHEVAAHEIEDVLAEERQAKPVPVIDTTPVTGPDPDVAPAPKPSRARKK